MKNNTWCDGKKWYPTILYYLYKYSNFVRVAGKIKISISFLFYLARTVTLWKACMKLSGTVNNIGDKKEVNSMYFL